MVLLHRPTLSMTDGPSAGNSSRRPSWDRRRSGSLIVAALGIVGACAVERSHAAMGTMTSRLVPVAVLHRCAPAERGRTPLPARSTPASLSRTSSVRSIPRGSRCLPRNVPAPVASPPAVGSPPRALARPSRPHRTRPTAPVKRPLRRRLRTSVPTTRYTALSRSAATRVGTGDGATGSDPRALCRDRFRGRLGRPSRPVQRRAPAANMRGVRGRRRLPPLTRRPALWHGGPRAGAARAEEALMDGLAGRTYVVTGAASGIGRATAARLVGAGANVALL